MVKPEISVHVFGGRKDFPCVPARSFPEVVETKGDSL